MLNTTKRDFLAGVGVIAAAGAVPEMLSAASTEVPAPDARPRPARTPGASVKKSILITGAGTGFGHDVALALAERGHQVIATVQLPAQVSQLRELARQRGLSMRVEKVDVLEERDRAFAASFDIDTLVNNAGIGEGGSVAEMPLDVFRGQFETNVFCPLDLTQRVVRRWVADKRPGKVVFVSSVLGLVSPEYVGAYAGSKHALEAVAESMHAELKPFDIAVSTINPAAYQTGFNDRMMEGWKRWYDPSRHFIDHTKLSFSSPQMDPAGAIPAFVAAIESRAGRFRNVVPAAFAARLREAQSAAWDQDV